MQLRAEGPDTSQPNNGVVHGPTGGAQLLVMQNLVNGTGNFTGNVVFNGGYSPGNSPVSVTLQNATFSPVNILTMEIGGTSPGSGYDRLNVTGTATLGGTLIVSLINGFTPSTGQSFDLFDGNVIGNFTNLSLPPLAPGLTWDTSPLLTTGTISVTSLAAIEAWRLSYFGSTANFGNGANLFDFDHDGLVNVIEFAFGQDPKLSSSAQLPSLQLSTGNLTYRFTTPSGVAGVTYGAENKDDMNPSHHSTLGAQRHLTRTI